MATLCEDWRAVKRELERMVCRMENRAAESAEDMRQQAYARGRRDGQAEARHDYCNGCGKQEFYDACNGHYRLIRTLLSLDSADREIVRTVVERLAAARKEENA
mgnify:FL=1